MYINLHPKHIELTYCILEICIQIAEKNEEGFTSIIEAMDYFIIENMTTLKNSKKTFLFVNIINQSNNIVMIEIIVKFLVRLLRSAPKTQKTSLIKELL